MVLCAAGGNSIQTALYSDKSGQFPPGEENLKMIPNESAGDPCIWLGTEHNY